MKLHLFKLVLLITVFALLSTNQSRAVSLSLLTHLGESSHTHSFEEHDDHDHGLVEDHGHHDETEKQVSKDHNLPPHDHHHPGQVLSLFNMDVNVHSHLVSFFLLSSKAEYEEFARLKIDERPLASVFRPPIS